MHLYTNAWRNERGNVPNLSDFHDKYSGRVWLIGNGPSMAKLSDEQRAALNEERIFVGSAFTEYASESGFSPDFYVLTERKQTTEWMDSGQYNKAQASEAKFWVNWNPAPEGWVSVNAPPGQAHDVLNYGTKCLEKGCQATDWVSHICHGKDTPLAMGQLAWYMGFRQMYLLGCETTSEGEVYNPTRVRNMHAGGILLPYYERAGRELGLIDCTFGGTLADVRGGPLKYMDLDEVLDAPVPA